jgi:hypothetical protein
MDAEVVNAGLSDQSHMASRAQRASVRRPAAFPQVPSCRLEVEAPTVLVPIIHRSPNGSIRASHCIRKSPTATTEAAPGDFMQRLTLVSLVSLKRRDRGPESGRAWRL